MEGGSGARSSGEGRTPPERRGGLGFKDRQPLLCDVPARPDADRGNSAVRWRSIASRAGSASKCAHRGTTRGGHGFPRHPGVRAHLGKALRLGRRAGGSDAEGGRHQAAWRAPGVSAGVTSRRAIANPTGPV
jgi:hypothetical protein